MLLPARTWAVRLLPLVAVIAFVSLASVSSAGTTPKKKPEDLSYTVILVMRNGNTIHYNQTSRVGGGGDCVTTTTEDDNFHALALYNPLEIPRSGPGPNNVNLRAKIMATNGGADEWTLRGNSAGCPVDSSYKCHGRLLIDQDKPPQMLSTPGLSTKSLHLKIELAKVITFTDAAGNFQPFGCAHQFDNVDALQPASSNGYMPDMLSARVDLPLDKMRALKSDEGKFTLDVSLDPSDAPPANCSGGENMCSERLEWKGEVIVIRRK
jgi:hypothetical protein